MAEDGGFADEVGRALFDQLKCPADDDLEEKLPRRPGIYAIFIDEPGNLRRPLDNRCQIDRAVDHIVSQMSANESKTGVAGLLYVGMAGGTTLVKRLFAQDLRGRGHATFFRSLGAVLGCMPCSGSLPPNGTNYVFKDDDKAEIVNWIKEHLSVTWVDDFGSVADIKRFETALITKQKPIFNKQKNPSPSEDLQALRAQCREKARASVIEGSGG